MNKTTVKLTQEELKILRDDARAKWDAWVAADAAALAAWIAADAAHEVAARADDEAAANE